MTPTPAEQHERAVLAATIARLPLATLRTLARIADMLPRVDVETRFPTVDFERPGTAFSKLPPTTPRQTAFALLASLLRALEWPGS